MLCGQKIILIRGIPGSGKSTLARKIVERGGIDGCDTMLGYDHWENEMFFIDQDGNFEYDTSKMKESATWCLARTIDSLLKGKDVVVANTFFRYIQMAPYIELAARFNFDIKIIECKGKFKSVHNTPADFVKITIEKYEHYEVYDGHE